MRGSYATDQISVVLDVVIEFWIASDSLGEFLAPLLLLHDKLLNLLKCPFNARHSATGTRREKGASINQALPNASGEKWVVTFDKKEGQFDMTEIDASKVQVLLNQRGVGLFYRCPPPTLPEHGGSHEVDNMTRSHQFLAESLKRIAP